MSFQLNYNGPSLHSYQSAVRAWEQADRWRGETGEFDERKLDGRKRHVTIRKTREGDIACKLHSTDVVTYHPDDSITIERWSSMSTDSFARAMLPGSLYSTFLSGGCDIWIKPVGGSSRFWDGDWQGWKFSGISCTFVPGEEGDEYTYAPKDLAETEPLEHTYLDAKLAAKARAKYRWNDFTTWFKAFTTLSRNPSPAFALSPRDHGTILALLQDGEYTKLFDVEQRTKIGDPTYPIKVAMYRAEDAICVEEYQHLVGYRSEKNILASSSRWA